MKIIEDKNKILEYMHKYELENVIGKELIMHCELHTFEKGDYICQTEQEVAYFYYFVEGKAKIYTLLENGKKSLLRFYQPLNVLGDVEVFHYNQYRVFVEALENSVCIGIPMKLVRLYGINNVVFLRFLGNHLAQKLDSITYKSSMNLYPLEARLSSYIIENIQNENNICEIESNYSDLAELLGTSYRHLNRMLIKLVRDQIIDKKGKTIIIMKKEELKALAGDFYQM
ncbi:MAG: transcriptional regulator [Firmicutes bacterium HGW-Firmicutes-7]|nr:MAG: transcriptional regulator [Firmicutes bacterium HGW-Firmicutes-7]